MNGKINKSYILSIFNIFWKDNQRSNPGRLKEYKSQGINGHSRLQGEIMINR